MRCDAESGTPVEIGSGEATGVILGGVTRGEVGKPGELSGVLNKRSIGSIISNNECGVFGIMSDVDIDIQAPIPVGCKTELHTGEAEIISTVKSGKKAKYKIEITEIDTTSTGSKSFKIKVKDPTLIALTGGIVRGMSGSPIIQDGKKEKRDLTEEEKKTIEDLDKRYKAVGGQLASVNASYEKHYNMLHNDLQVQTPTKTVTQTPYYGAHMAYGMAGRGHYMANGRGRNYYAPHMQTKVSVGSSIASNQQQEEQQQEQKQEEKKFTTVTAEDDKRQQAAQQEEKKEEKKEEKVEEKKEEKKAEDSEMKVVQVEEQELEEIEDEDVELEEMTQGNQLRTENVILDEIQIGFDMDIEEIIEPNKKKSKGKAQTVAVEDSSEDAMVMTKVYDPSKN